MSSKNVETARAEHDSFNRHQLTLAGFADQAVYVDVPRGLTLRGKGSILERLQDWHKAMSDCTVGEASYIDAGDKVIAEFTGSGTNDGPLGPFPATGRKASMRMCEIFSFDAAGKITEIHAYYDQVTMLAQLGHIKL